MKQPVGLSVAVQPGWGSSTLSLPAGLINSGVSHGLWDLSRPRILLHRSVNEPGRSVVVCPRVACNRPARPHWQTAITAAQNAERSPSQIDKAADALKAALKADSLFVSWSRLPEF